MVDNTPKTLGQLKADAASANLAAATCAGAPPFQTDPKTVDARKSLIEIERLEEMAPSGKFKSDPKCGNTWQKATEANRKLFNATTKAPKP